VMADLLLSVAALMRTQARQFTPLDESGDVRETPAPLQGQLLREQAALRDLLLASELDLAALRSHPGHARALRELRRVLEQIARDTAALADSLLLGRHPAAGVARHPAPEGSHP